MTTYVPGQRFISEPEPELGLGIVAQVEGFRVSISFPASGESRIYAAGAGVLKRALYRPGERVTTREGKSFAVETADEIDGLLVYRGDGEEAREDDLVDSGGFSRPQDLLLAGQADSSEAFALRLETLRARAALRASPLRGFLGGRVDLIPHQYYILQEVSSRQLPRVLLSDEVGLGKTIEACLILQRLRVTGRAERALILVPEALVHQWFVELLRRFNLWFSILDEERCVTIGRSSEDGNPFLDEQLVLCSLPFLARNERRARQVAEAGWDLVIVDEAHHLAWTPERPSPEYALVEALGRSSPGLLLLTATPTQLGLEGHFARLRLLDPDRYADFAAFQAEAEDYGEVARIANEIVEKRKLGAKDKTALKRIFHRDPDGLKARLEAVDAGKAEAREELLKSLLDEHGTGRVVFRNTRSTMSGFPKRKYCPAPLASDDDTLLKKLARELEAESRDGEADIRYNFKADPRLDWLVSFVKARKEAKMLLICKSRQKAVALEAALKERVNINVGLFHEELALVQRDRNAAWFAEPDGAQLLICSEIGSEGRNFQFAHHLALFDLPLNPGLLEQRIGRLDRIGQTHAIQIHVPFVVGSPQEFVAEWYHQGLDAFESCVHGGNEYQARFRERLLELALASGSGKRADGEARERFIQETEAFREALTERMRNGRDRLLELNSFDPKVAAEVIARVREAESDPGLRRLLFELLEFFGVRLDEHEGGEVSFDASRAYVEGFPAIPPDGALATFDRAGAIVREDVMFVTPDHPLVLDTLDLMASSDRGVTALGICESDESNLLLEAVFALETVALSRLRVDRFLAPTPIRVVVDARGRERSAELDAAWMASNVEDGSINRFLERPGFNREILQAMLGGAESFAEGTAKRIKSAAKAAAKKALGDEIRRLVDLKKINDNVSDQEIQLATEELKGALAAVGDSRLRLDSLRLIVQGDVDGLEAQ